MNHNQKIRIDRIYTQPFYLINKYKENEDFIFQVSGSTANLYTVKINTSSENLITCDCPDASSWALKCNVKCKHCCFVIIKVLGLDSQYLDPIKSNSQYYLKQIINACQNRVINKELFNEDYKQRYNELQKSNVDKFTVTKVLDEESDCPICFDKLLSEISSQCPTCNNIVHTQCIKKWLSVSNKNCVYCRGDWSDFLHNNITKNEYINLNT